MDYLSYALAFLFTALLCIGAIIPLLLWWANR